jgi:phosphatidylglycerophosphate synthase
MMTSAPRRELATRHASWARRLASLLGRAGVRPNTVSIGSVMFALTAFIAFAFAPAVDPISRALLLVTAAAAIQLRLLCNLLDGMLAVEEGLKTKNGELFNEIPDRIADVLVLVGAGCSMAEQPAGILVGGAAALAAVFTAYVRVLGGSLGVTQPFSGPMAKQHRMFVVTLAALVASVETLTRVTSAALPVALVVVTAGAVLTAFRRVALINQDVEAR